MAGEHHVRIPRGTAAMRDPVPSPDFVRGSDLLEAAFRFAQRAHHGPRRAGDTNVEHPVGAARILHEAGFGDTIVAAALLHDVLEDTRTGEGELRQRFGPEVAGLVAALTEDASILDYPARKRAHRARILAAGEDAAAIFAADKLATLRALGDRPQLPAQRLEHFSRSATEVAAAHPDLPFLEELDRRVGAIEVAPAPA